MVAKPRWLIFSSFTMFFNLEDTFKLVCVVGRTVPLPVRVGCGRPGCLRRQGANQKRAYCEPIRAQFGDSQSVPGSDIYKGCAESEQSVCPWPLGGEGQSPRVETSTADSAVLAWPGLGEARELEPVACQAAGPEGKGLAGARGHRGSGPGKQTAEGREGQRG